MPAVGGLASKFETASAVDIIILPLAECVSVLAMLAWAARTRWLLQRAVILNNLLGV